MYEQQVRQKGDRGVRGSLDEMKRLAGWCGLIHIDSMGGYYIQSIVAVIGCTLQLHD